ncbi:helicase with zinc finger domain 2-like [Saccostrea echinata]|uniref:helicase with zinc finger domain 2-like n=1 Tax=Saccostrea echinata TaxID=191078 RepID=UPI002A83DCBB|nr:helicase with zinc finger domain 2-like [Saccostrea echinata]
MSTSTDESDGDGDNYTTLRECFEKPCTKLLRNILRLKFSRFEELKEVIPLENLSDGLKSALERLNRIKQLNFPILCEIFRLGVCERFFGPPAIGWYSTEIIPEEFNGVSDDIQRIWKIWKENIENNVNFTVSDNDSNKAFTILKDIGERMRHHQDFKEFGQGFYKEICLARKGSIEELHFNAIQAGDGNTMKMNIDSSFKGQVNVAQGGTNNTFILYLLKDNRLGGLEYKSTGYVQATAVLHSDDPAFQELTENASGLSIEEINELPALKDNNVSINEIKRGSLVISFMYNNKDTLEKNLDRIFQGIFTKEKIEEVFRRHQVQNVTVKGYIYDHLDYYLDYVPKELIHSGGLAKVHWYSHLTWKFAECTCDVDVILSDLLHNLLLYDVTTEANDNIWIMIKGSIISPDDVDFSLIERLLVVNVDSKIKRINDELNKLGQCEIQYITQKKKTIHMVLKVNDCLSYSDILAEEGILLPILKAILWSEESHDFISKVQLMRIGLIIDTKWTQNQSVQTSHSLIIEFCPESNITKAINNGVFKDILTAVLEKSESPSVEMPNRMKIKVDINGVREPSHDEKTYEKERIQRRKCDNVQEEPTSFIYYSSKEDSAVESDEEYLEKPHKLISYQDPEYDHLYSESTDSGFELLEDRSFSGIYSRTNSSVFSNINIDFVINGLELSEKCEDDFRHKRKPMFHYDTTVPEKTLQRYLDDNPNKYKLCSLHIESAHKAVCTNLNFADEIKEIHISGRSKCGKSYADDEVVVEILGESKIRKYERKRRNIESQTRDTNIYGRILGTVKRNRYKNMRHPVLVCAFDDFGHHMLKPLCKTVPKIQASHKYCKGKTQFDLFTYDKYNKNLSYKEILKIDHANRKSYCFLVAIMHWEDMYPFGVVLSSTYTRNDPQSGIDILRLQYQIPDKFTDMANRIASHLQQIDVKTRSKTRSKGVVPVFAISIEENITEIAFSVEKISDLLHRIEIHIVDPARFIKKGDGLDKEIRRRGAQFDIYKNYQSLMIPEQLCDIIEFKLDEDRHAKTLSFTANSQSDVDTDSFTLRKSIVVCQKVYDIESVNDVLEGNQDFKVKTLLNIAKNIRKERLGDGTHFLELETRLQDNGTFMRNKYVRDLLQELILFTNMKISERVSKRYQKFMPYRCHQAPSIDVVKLWNESHTDMGDILCRLQSLEAVPGTGSYCSVFNFGREFSYRHVLPFQRCVWETLKEHINKNQWNEVGHILGMDEIHPWQLLALEDWINVQTLAEYRCLNQKHDPLLHYALRRDHYMTFTSPLRLYIDLVAHRLLDDLLSSDKKDCSYNTLEIEQICNEMNDILLRRKKFYSGCQVLLCGHELYMQPQLFNGFVHDVSNIDISLCYPSLRKFPEMSKRIPLNFLRTKERPSFQENRIHKRDILTMKWQSRLYSIQRKLERNKNNDGYLRLNPHPNMVFQQKQQWINLLKSYFRGKTKNLKKEINHEDRMNLIRTIEETHETVEDVSSEDRLGVDSNQTCKFSLSFNYGQIVVVQMAGEPEHGMMMPMPQLLDLTNNVKLCLQHARDPVNVLAEFASKATKESYASCKEYVNIWIPILSMEIATLSVEDESFTITDLPITFTSKRKGSFFLSNSFCEQRDISFTVHSTDLLGYSDLEEVEVDSEVKPFYISGSDYLCIRCEIGLGPRSKFLNGSVSPQNRFWVAHAKIDDVRKEEAAEGKIKVNFICHKKSPAIPKDLRGQQKICHVEIIPKIEVHRRTDMYLKNLKRAPDLAKAIAERSSIPKLDQEHVCAGRSLCRNADYHLGIRLNDNQRKAIQKAVTSSFTLIQGPPGTGKTYTGVALINIFCSINHQLRENGGNRRIVLFCGPSNKSVDLVTRYLKENDFSRKFKVLRMYGRALECAEFPIPGKVFSKRRVNKESFPDENLRNETLHHIIREEGKTYAEEIKQYDEKFKTNPKKINFGEIKKYKKCIGKAIQEELPKYDVILCTASVATSASLLAPAKGTIFQVLIDEAGMCTEPECMAVIVATRAKQVVLIGDHKQLQPVVICEEAAELGLQKSLFERYAEMKSSHLTFLNLQYRMNPCLCEFPSKTFYDGKLETKESEKWMTRTPLRLWKNPQYPYVFCHTEGEEEYLTYTTEEGNEMARYNSNEIERVAAIFSYLVKTEKINWESINIMSQYNAQCHQIRLALKKKKFEFYNVNTVVASQGGEWDYVIFSLVRSLPEYRIEPEPTLGWCKENLGFITDVHQINVALTRARKGLILIGNQNLMSCEKSVLNPMLTHFRRNNCIVNTMDFLPKHGAKVKT